MRSEEAKAILTPMFEEFERNYSEGNMQKSIEDHFHPHGVVVHKGKSVQYGKKQVLEEMSKMIDQYGKVKFHRSNECFCGCDGCICAAYDVSFDSEKKGKMQAKVFQMWKKEGNEWKLYHDEYDMSK